MQNAVQKVGEEEMMQNFPCSGAASSSTSNTLSAMETMLADAWYDEEADRYVRKKSSGGKHGKLMTPAEFPTLIGNRCKVANKRCREARRESGKVR